MRTEQVSPQASRDVGNLTDGKKVLRNADVCKVHTIPCQSSLSLERVVADIP